MPVDQSPMLYTVDLELVTSNMNRPILPKSQIITPAQTEAAAAKLAPRLFTQATGTNVEGAFPMQEFDWRRAVDLHIGLLLTSPGTNPPIPTAKKSFLRTGKTFLDYRGVAVKTLRRWRKECPARCLYHLRSRGADSPGRAAES